MDLNVTWQTIITIAGGLIVLFQLGKWVISLGNPFIELKRRIDKHDDFLDKDKQRLDRVDKSIQQIDEGLGVVGLAIAEMISHEISGNDVSKLRQQQEKVTTYFYGRKTNDEE